MLSSWGRHTAAEWGSLSFWKSEHRGALKSCWGPTFSSFMRPDQKSLLALVIRIFAAGVLTAAERTALTTLYRDAGLTVSEVRAVLVEFVKATCDGGRRANQ